MKNFKIFYKLLIEKHSIVDDANSENNTAKSKKIPKHKKFENETRVILNRFFKSKGYHSNITHTINNSKESDIAFKLNDITSILECKMSYTNRLFNRRFNIIKGKLQLVKSDDIDTNIITPIIKVLNDNKLFEDIMNYISKKTNININDITIHTSKSKTAWTSINTEIEDTISISKFLELFNEFNKENNKENAYISISDDTSDYRSILKEWWDKKHVNYCRIGNKFFIAHNKSDNQNLNELNENTIPYFINDATPLNGIIACRISANENDNRFEIQPEIKLLSYKNNPELKNLIKDNTWEFNTDGIINIDSKKLLNIPKRIRNNKKSKSQQK